MLTTSPTYKSIFADPAHTVQWKITVYGTDYTGEKIASAQTPRLSRRLIDGDEPTIGQCIAATFSCAIYEASSAVPRMAPVSVSYRLALPLPEGSSADPTVSEWITLGTTYIDTREVDKATKALILSCYDKMLVGNVTYLDVTGIDEWPQSQATVAAEIAEIMGISLDSRTSLRTGEGYMVEYPNDLSCLEVLGYIGVANAGNWCITPANELRLVPLTGGSGSLDLGSAVLGGLRVPPELERWAGVVVYYADEAAYEAGDTTGETGRVLTCECPWATQATADGILDAIEGHAYQPFSVAGAVIDLALELGDSVTAGLTGETVSGPVFTIDVTGSGIERADISAPGDAEIDHEYPYASYVDRSLKRKVGLGVTYEGVTISRQYGIQILGVTNGEETNRALLNSRQFTMDVKTPAGWEQQFYFDPERRAYVFKGALGADSIYADMGDIAELTVDRLSTSKKVRLYNLQNTGDDNFVHIQDNFIRLTTGSVKYDPNDPVTPLTEQATNRWGDPLYWQAIPDHINAQGYPEDADGNQIYATTDQPTPGEGETLDQYKVMVYQYTELVKTELAFVNESGTYVPMLIMGAGDEHGYTKGILHKAADRFDISFTTTAGDENGIKMWSAGYMDLYGLRKPTNLNFSNWDSGSFSETLDGGHTNSYIVRFDQDNLPYQIIDGLGHVTEVEW